MIILEGPDCSGKTTLGERLVYQSKDSITLWKAVAATNYEEYMTILRGEKVDPLDRMAYQPAKPMDEGAHYVMDRFFYSEGPYAEVVRKGKLKFSLKEFHNMQLSTLSYNPITILFTKKGTPYNDETIPEELFGPILQGYRDWFDALGVEYIEWEFDRPPMTPQALINRSLEKQKEIAWWLEMARAGLAGVGNTVNPRVLVLAEEIGPSNVHKVAFELGPSGFYLSDLLDEAEIPLGSFYLTNWKKTGKSAEDYELLKSEFEHTGAKKVIFLGGEAKTTSDFITEECGIPVQNMYAIKHPGWVVNHAGSIREQNSRKAAYIIQWTDIWNRALGRETAGPAKIPENLQLTKVS